MKNLRLPKIAIIGKPNVGKSTLFNALCKKKLATIDEKPGLTRDRKYYQAQLYDLKFIAIDTAGWDDIDGGDIEALMMNQTQKAVEEADLCLFVVDGIEGIGVFDEAFSKVVRKIGKRFLFVVNKMESIKVDIADVYSFGFDKPIYISAIHKTGFEDLYLRMKQEISDMNLSPESENSNDEAFGKNGVIALVGRPNAGKSTLFNALLKKNRSIVCDKAGTTRDTVVDTWKDRDLKFEIVDTAGLSRKNRGGEDPFVGQTIAAIRRSNVALLMMEAGCALEKQDLMIARIAINEGKGLLLLINKIDLYSADEQKLLKKEISMKLRESLGEIAKPSITYISALHEEDFSMISTELDQILVAWSVKLGTGSLNRWLREALSAHEPELMSNGRRLKFKYIVQIASKPPTFNIYCNSKSVSFQYLRYLKKSLAKKFQLVGIPIRLNICVGENPYDIK